MFGEWLKEEQANTAKEACWFPQISALKKVWPSPEPVLKGRTLPEEFAANKNRGTPSWLYWKSRIKVGSWPLTVQPRMWEIDTLSNAFTARLRVWGKKSCLSHLIVLLHDGVWMPSLRTDYNCHFRLIQCSAALRPHLLLRMSDRTAATYDQTLLSLCTRDSSLREALMCCQQCSPLSCLDLPSPSVSVKQH